MPTSAFFGGSVRILIVALSIPLTASIAECKTGDWPTASKRGVHLAMYR